MNRAWENEQNHSITPPLYKGVAYGFKTCDEAAAAFEGKGKGFAYARMGTPTVKEFERWLTELEGGWDTFATNSGLAATNLLLMATSGESKEVVTSPCIYGGTHYQFQLFNKLGWQIKFVENPFDLKSWDEAITGKTTFVFLETPANPRLDVFDIEAIAEVAHRNKTFLVVDNTVATPAIQKPFDWGADAIIHSVTKYLVRNSTGLGGSLTYNKAFGERHHESLAEWFVHLGVIMPPEVAHTCLLNRQTLKMDMKAFSKNAELVAYFLSASPKIKQVHYPGLVSHPQHKLVKKQMGNNYSGMLAFETGSYGTAKKLVNSLQKVIIAPHLGAIDDLIIHPASTTHRRVPEHALSSMGINEGLVRFSVGLGEVEEVIADFKQALERI